MSNTLEEAKDLLSRIDEVIEETSELENPVVETKPEPSIEIEEETSVVSTVEAQAHIDAINEEEKVADDKTLLESIYEKEEVKMKEEAKDNLDKVIEEEKLLPVDLEAQKKEQEAEAIAEDITKAMSKKQTPEELIEQLTDIFIEKEERLSREVRLLTKKNDVLEEIVERQTKEINKMKYDDGKVEIVDKFMGSFVNAYWEAKSDPSNEKALNRLSNLYLSEICNLYPELSVKSINNLILESREAKLNAIQGITSGSEKDWNIKTKIETQPKSRPMGFVIW